MNKMILRVVRMVPVLTLLSCATTQTQITSSWRQPNYSGTLQKVFVIGLAKDQDKRKQYENDFTSQLKNYGVTAIPSYTVFSGDKIPDKETLKAELAKDGIDTVLITRVVSNKDVQTYVPGSYGPYGDYWGYYGYGWDYAYSPGYTVMNREVVLESNLYNTSDEKLIWSATSKSTTQGNDTSVIQSFITALINKMRQDKLIK